MNLKYSIKGQVVSVILEHLRASTIFFVAWILTIRITSSVIGGIVYSVIATFFYLTLMYSAGYQALKNDKKSYSPLTPKKYKGALLSLGLLALSILIVIAYLIAWRVAGDGENLITLWAVAVNVLYLFWYSPFVGFLGTQKGTISMLGYIIIFVLPTASCFLGYFAGYKGFDISEKLRTLIYEKKE